MLSRYMNTLRSDRTTTFHFFHFEEIMERERTRKRKKEKMFIFVKNVFADI